MLKHSDDRRTLTTAFPVLVVDRQRLRCYNARVQDFSKSGCTIRHAQPGKLPEIMSLEIEGMAALINARVLWRKAQRVRVEFLWDEDSRPDNRGERRVAVSIPAHVCNVNGTLAANCVIVEASRSGCRIEGPLVGELDDHVLIKIERIKSPVPGTIVWRDGKRAGIKLLWNTATRHAVEERGGRIFHMVH